MQFLVSLASLAVSLASLVVSFFVAISQFYQWKRLKRLEQESDQARFIAKLIKNDRPGSYDLEISNVGKVDALNVRVDSPEQGSLSMTYELDEKFPLESLSPGCAVRIGIQKYLETNVRKFCVNLTWDDESDKNRQASYYLTF